MNGIDSVSELIFRALINDDEAVEVDNAVGARFICAFRNIDILRVKYLRRVFLPIVIRVVG